MSGVFARFLPCSNREVPLLCFSLMAYGSLTGWHRNRYPGVPL